jgi:hypothetical protein
MRPLAFRLVRSQRAYAEKMVHDLYLVGGIDDLQCASQVPTLVRPPCESGALPLS